MNIHTRAGVHERTPCNLVCTQPLGEEWDKPYAITATAT